MKLSIYFILTSITLVNLTIAQLAEPEINKKTPTSKDTKTKSETTGEVASSPIQACITEYRDKIKQLRKELSAISTRENKIEYYEQHKPDSSPYRQKIIALLKQDPKQKHAEIGIVWVMKLGTRQEVSQVKPIIYEHYRESDSMGMYIFWLYQAGHKNLAELEAISASTKNINIKENADFYTAQIYKKYLSLDRLTDEERAAFKQKSIKLLNSIMESPTLEKRNLKLYELCQKSLDTLTLDSTSETKDNSDTTPNTESPNRKKTSRELK